MADNQDQLVELLADLEENAVLDLVRQRLAGGEDPLRLIHACNRGMQLVGKRYEEGQFFISGLIMSGEIYREVMDIVQPRLVTPQAIPSLGTVLIGTVAGDIHDIGKNIASLVLACNGFSIVDLGMDVPETDFAKKAAMIHPDIVGLSGLITTSIDSAKATIAMLHMVCSVNGLHFPIVIGGGVMSESVRRYVGADYCVSDAMEGVALFQSLVREQHVLASTPEFSISI